MDVNHSSLHKSQSDSRTSARHGVDDKTGYHRLPENHVRLVRISPGDDLYVTCETRVFALPLSSGYTALSYAWGPPVAEHAIILDGREHLVAENLCHFLTTWRFFCRKRAPAIFSAQGPSWKPCFSWLWIDALSIDQNNIQERNHQVKIMSSIFGGADEVLVWLGLAETGPRMTSFNLKNMLVGFELEDGVPEGLQRICERMYWTRLWVFQELKSAKQTSLMCGDEIIRFEELAKPLTGEDSDFEVEGQPKWLLRNSVATRMLLLCGQNAPTSLWLLLQVTQHLNCYDPLDKVYALLSLAKSGAEGIEADYTLPLPELMNRVLINLYATGQPPSAGDLAIRCARFKIMMGLEPCFPWGADDYFAAEELARTSTEPT
jgi:hypothetical protein